ncbi:hypothetical protein V5799_009657 [Amblyomma americanum]|uniref:Uncharacterized protein n=1 Tax=Amblyomma americanum TaxID=6943 RepID=A0AAQ4FA79_AMBAM
MPFDIVTSMRAHCFNVEHGCPYQATLQDVHEHFELYCRFHPLSCRYCRRQDILIKDIVTHLRICRGGRSSGEKAYVSGHHGSQERGVAGAVACAPKESALALKMGTSEKTKSFRKELDLAVLFATGIGKLWKSQEEYNNETALVPRRTPAWTAQTYCSEVVTKAYIVNSLLKDND